MSKVQLRSKFIKACPSIEAQNQVIREFEHLYTLAEDQALAYLWQRYIEACEPTEDTDSSRFKLLAWRELRSQYTCTHPGFPRVYIPDSCKKSYESFAEINPVVAAVVSNVSLTYIKQNIIWVDRTMFLLNNDKEANYFGGIKELGFNYAEATVLKSFIKQIRNIFGCLCKHYQALDLSNGEVPFIFSSQEEDMATITYPQIEESVEKNDEFTSDPLALTILQNHQTIEKFCQVIDSIEALGLNPSELLSKKDAIKAFLDALGKL